MKDTLAFACVFRTVDQQLGIQFSGPRKNETVTVYGVDIEKKEFRVSSTLDEIPSHVRKEACRKYSNMVQNNKFVRYPKFKNEQTSSSAAAA